jgi:hypothetical protein
MSVYCHYQCCYVCSIGLYVFHAVGLVMLLSGLCVDITLYRKITIKICNTHNSSSVSFCLQDIKFITQFEIIMLLTRERRATWLAKDYKNTRIKHKTINKEALLRLKNDIWNCKVIENCNIQIWNKFPYANIKYRHKTFRNMKLHLCYNSVNGCASEQFVTWYWAHVTKQFHRKDFFLRIW